MHHTLTPPVIASGRLIAGNLDCERRYAAARDRSGSPEAGPLPPAIAAVASAFATLLRAFAEPGDRVWTPAPVDPGRVSEVAEIPAPTLEEGPLPDAQAAPALLAWAETAETAALRRRWGPAGEAAAEPTSGRGAHEPLWRGVWALPAPDPDVAAACNHRGFAFELARARGWALPGARRVASVAEIERHLAAGGARAGSGAWIAKAPFGAAGRERVGQRGGALRDDVRTRLERLLSAHGELLFEPWVARRADFGVCGIARAEGARVLAPHRMICDGRGVVRALEVAEDRPPGSPRLRALLESAASAAGSALARRGYRGPYNIDAFTYRDERGAVRIQPLCELNARLSFGMIARALYERVAAPRGARGARLDLRPADAAAIPAGARAVPLLDPPPGAPGPGATLVLL